MVRGNIGELTHKAINSKKKIGMGIKNHLKGEPKKPSYSFNDVTYYPAKGANLQS
jgi:hypothetical protein